MPADEQPDRGAAARRVLVVEDEMLVALLMEGMLADLGYRVAGPAAHLDKALEMAREDAVDAAILDVNVNGKEVYPVADALAARGIPFAFATGYVRAGLRAPYRDRPVLQKPFQRHDLRNLIADMFSGEAAASKPREGGRAGG